MLDFNSSIKEYLNRTGFSSIQPLAALIDMDGTLYDSMPSHAHAWKLLTDEIGFDIPQDEFFCYEGMTGEATLRMFFEREGLEVPTAEEIKKLYQRKTEFFKRDGKAPLMPGASLMIHELKELGISRVLVTGSGQMSIIEKVCDDFDGLFNTSAMITSHDVIKGKPDPEPYIKGMAIAGTEPWQSIVIENAPLGIISGRNSNAFTIGVCTGPIPAGRMMEAGPDILFDSMPEFAANLPSLINEMRNFNV